MDPTTTTVELLDLPAEGPDDLPKLIEARRQARRLTPVTVGLAGAVLVAGGFLGGLLAQRHLGSPTGGSSAAAAARGLAASAGRGAGSTASRVFGGASSGGVTVGSVAYVKGDTVYLTTTGGGTVKVIATGATKVDMEKSGGVSDLTPGQTVVVQGSRNADGTVSASTIREGSGGALGGFARTGSSTSGSRSPGSRPSGGSSPRGSASPPGGSG